MESASFFDFVKRAGLADASVRSIFRMVAVLAFVMVAAEITPEVELMKLSALSRRVAGLAVLESAAVPCELGGHREDEAVESMLVEGVEPIRAPCSRREETS